RGVPNRAPPPAESGPRRPSADIIRSRIFPTDARGSGRLSKYPTMPHMNYSSDLAAGDLAVPRDLCVPGRRRTDASTVVREPFDVNLTLSQEIPGQQRRSSALDR